MTTRQPNPSTRAFPGRAAEHALAGVFALLLAFGLVLAVPGYAQADVRKADVIAGESVDDRGLAVSDCPSITAEFAALASEDGTVYFSRGGEERSQIASITKVMTAIVAVDNAPGNLEVTVSAEAAEVGESSAGLQEGDVMDLETALKALLVPSGNDAAIALAQTVGEGLAGQGQDPEQAFVDAMNAKAAELGLEDTLYENPHGLDDGEFEGDLHSTAIDQLKVARCAMGYPQISEIVGGGSTTIQVKRGGEDVAIELETTDLLLESYPYATGIKTGMTNSAGPSFMGASEKDGEKMYAVVLGCADEYSRFEDAKELFSWGYEHIVDVALANSDEWTSMRIDGMSEDVPVVAEASHYEWIDRTVKATLADPGATVNVFDLEGNVSQKVELDELHGTVEAGDKVGTISFYQNNGLIAQQDLIACERVEAPNPIDTVAIWWQRLTQGLDDATGRASSRVLSVMPIIKDNTTNSA